MKHSINTKRKQLMAYTASGNAIT